VRPGRRRALGVALVVAGALGAAGCASLRPGPRDDVYVLLPDADGRAGALTVSQGQDQQVLDTAYAAARIGPPGRLERARLAEDEVRRRFGGALSAEPPAPVSFTLYFILGTDELMADSQQVLAQVTKEVLRRPGADVVVIGHTDRVGGVQRNDALSLQRAERIRTELLKLGLPADRVRAAGRGEREPVVATPDDVAEPRNRRVELTIR